MSRSRRYTNDPVKRIADRPALLKEKKMSIFPTIIQKRKAYKAKKRKVKYGLNAVPAVVIWAAAQSWNDLDVKTRINNLIYIYIYI